MSDIVIKKATVKDIDTATPLFNAYRIWYHQQPDMEKAKAFLTERLRNNDSAIYLAYAGDEAAGFMQLYPIFSSVSLCKAWLLNDLFIDEKFRGKKIGKALLDEAKNLGVETNCKWLMLQTNFDNYHAQHLYENNGWVKEKDFFYTIHL